MQNILICPENPAGQSNHSYSPYGIGEIVIISPVPGATISVASQQLEHGAKVVVVVVTGALVLAGGVVGVEPPPPPVFATIVASQHVA